MKAAEESHHFFKSLDGTELHCLRILPEKKRGVLALIHGLAEHSGRYRFFCNYFAGRGWAIYLLDQRGHGHSPGARGHTNRLEDLVDDLSEFVNHVASQEKGLPLFLVAHSFGGQIGVNYLARRPKLLRGAVLSSPNLKLAMRISPLKKLVGRAAARFFPGFRLPNDIDASLISRDPEVVRLYREDPMVGNKITLKMGAEILNNLDSVMRLAPKIKTPCLIVHGEEDQIVSVEGSREFFDRLTIQDRTLKTYPGYFHETFNETGKEKVFADIQKWLESHLEKGKPSQ